VKGTARTLPRSSGTASRTSPGGQRLRPTFGRQTTARKGGRPTGGPQSGPMQYLRRPVTAGSADRPRWRYFSRPENQKRRRVSWLAAILGGDPGHQTAFRQHPRTSQKPAKSGLFFRVRPAWARSWRWKSSRELTTANEAKRNCVRVTERGEEAWSETASRWTRTG
jgi:hypothetical protein